MRQATSSARRGARQQSLLLIPAADKSSVLSFISPSEFKRKQIPCTKMAPPPPAEREMRMGKYRTVLAELMSSSPYQKNQAFFKHKNESHKTLEQILEDLQTGYYGVERFNKDVMAALTHATERATNLNDKTAANHLIAIYRRQFAIMKSWLAASSPIPQLQLVVQVDPSQVGNDPSEKSGRSSPPAPPLFNNDRVTSELSSVPSEDDASTRNIEARVKVESQPQPRPEPSDARLAKRQRISSTPLAQINSSQRYPSHIAPAQATPAQHASTSTPAPPSLTQPTSKFEVGDLVKINASDSPFKSNELRISAKSHSTVESGWHYQIPSSTIVPGTKIFITLPEACLVKVAYEPGKAYLKHQPDGSTYGIHVNKVEVEDGKLRYHARETVRRDRVFTSDELAGLLPVGEFELTSVSSADSHS